MIKRSMWAVVPPLIGRKMKKLRSSTIERNPGTKIKTNHCIINYLSFLPKISPHMQKM
jgi:hypothetical protein